MWMISGIIVTRILEEFQKKRDFVEQYTPLTKETYGNFTKMVHSQKGMRCFFCCTCKLVEFENATKALEKAKPKNQEMKAQTM
ncbi:unnamed protein product [Pocillopora meandrina]|uniref:Uncharacterized protein n=1 Tax=Pocillopora meandrina TaxID=46732 RepID=A0AAU9X541_9CNID|nr:unnamed protein product [Pocillopora meandrina]